MQTIFIDIEQIKNNIFLQYVIHLVIVKLPTYDVGSCFVNYLILPFVIFIYVQFVVMFGNFG